MADLPTGSLRDPETASRPANKSVKDHEAFGMWRDRKDMADVDVYVRNLRKGRLKFDLGE